MNIREVFSQRILKLRKENELTQQQAADELEISRVSLGYYETGQRLPDAEMLAKIASFYDVSSDYLLGRTGTQAVDVTVQAMCAYTGLTEENVEELHDRMVDDDFDEYGDFSFFLDLTSPNKTLLKVINTMLEEFLESYFDFALAKLAENTVKLAAFERVAVKQFCEKENLCLFTDEEIEAHGKDVFNSKEFRMEYPGITLRFEDFMDKMRESITSVSEADVPVDEIDYWTYQTEKEFSKLLADIMGLFSCRERGFYEKLYSQLLEIPTREERIEFVLSFYKEKYPEIYRQKTESYKKNRNIAQKFAAWLEDEENGKHNHPQE